jgi:C4-dicarboxylate transporter DctQ subunit
VTRVIKIIDKNLEQFFMGIFLVSISTIMFIQVFMRLLGASLAWAEELCRYMYVWSVFLSISLTIKKQTILR